MEKLLTTEEVADYLRVDVVTVRRLVNRGDLAAYRIGGEYRFTEPDVEEFVKRQRVSTGEQGNREMFGYFNEGARKVMKLAITEAEKLGHNYVGTEHMLLGLASEGEGLAAHILGSFDFDIERARNAIRGILEQGQQRSNPVLSKIKAAMFQGEVLAQGRQVSLTKRAKKVIELALIEAKRMEHHYVGTEHLLLGILIEGDGLALGVLEMMGIDPGKVRAKTLEELNTPKKEEE